MFRYMLESMIILRWWDCHICQLSNSSAVLYVANALEQFLSLIGLEYVYVIAGRRGAYGLE